MSKYREQMFRLLMASKKDDPGIIMKLKEQHSKVIHSINIIGNGIEGQLVNLFFSFLVIDHFILFTLLTTIVPSSFNIY